jgi:hypothetical protein
MSPLIGEVALSFLKDAKNQRTIILVLSGILAFGLGYWSKHCPPKSVVCAAEDKIIKGLQIELTAKDDVRTQQLREQRDADRLTCDERVEQSKQDQMAANDFLQCSDICALYQQCYDAGRCEQP